MSVNILKHKLLRVCFGLFVSAALLFLCVRNIQWVEIEGSISNANLVWVGCAVTLYWVELCLRIFRWRVLLSHVPPYVDGKLASIAFLSGYAANNVLPAKLGEVFRADLFGRLTKSSRLTALGSIILERLLDMIVILVMATWGVLTLTEPRIGMAKQISHILLVIGAMLLAMVVGIVLLIQNKNKFFPSALHRLSVRFQHFVTGLHLLGGPLSYAKLVIASGVIWVLNSLAIWSIAMALGVSLTMDQTLLLMGIMGISAAIPAGPAGIGTLQYAFYLAFYLTGLSSSTGIAASVIVQVALLGSATVVGGVVYYHAAATQFKKLRYG